MSKFSIAIAFFIGAAVGGGAAWYYADQKYAYLAEQEINSVKEAYAKQQEKLKRTAETEVTASISAVAAKPPEKGDITDYARRVQNGDGFTPYSTTVVQKAEHHDTIPEEFSIGAPYVISPEEFGELDDYTQVSLTCFEDGILSDENGVIIENPEEIVGDALNHFGEYEEDSVFVRSDVRRCDYEILRDLRSYAEFRTTLPPKI